MQATGPNKFLCLILIFMLYEKQTAKHFLKLKKFKNLGIPGKLYKDYFHFNIYLLKIPFSICFSTFCEPIQKVETKSCFLKRPRVMKEYSSAPKYFVIPLPPPCHSF